MIDLEEINQAIDQLESTDPTFDSCQKLAALYIVRDKLTKMGQNGVFKELSDIFPSYAKYAENKRKFQLHEVSEDSLYAGINLLCIEISEFIRALYASTNTEIERTELRNLIESLQTL